MTMRGLLILLLAAGCGDDDSSAADAPPGAIDASADAVPGTADARPPGPGQTGTPCALDDDCVDPNTFCLLDANGSGWDTFPGGYCTIQFCAFGEACGEGGKCAPLPGYGPHCFVECTTNGDCREAEGYTCQQSMFIAESLCMPPPG